MAIDFENLIDINLLSYYDANIKNFILEQINNSKNLIFISKTNLPNEGQINILYVTEEGLYLWDIATNKYVQIISNKEQNVIFVNNKDELPTKGQTEILYIVDKTFYIWKDTEYINLSIVSTEDVYPIQWENF